MVGVEITITVEGDGGDLYSELADALDGEQFEGGTHLEVRNDPGACGPCRANKDPMNVPCWECTGNIRRIDPDDPKGNLCRCRVVRVDDNNIEKDIPIERDNPLDRR